MSDYAIVKTGGKQYRVSPGDLIRVETLPGETGDVIILDEVLMKSVNGVATFGDPIINNSKVTAKIVDSGRGKKITVFKYKAKTRYRRKNGHRQPYTDLKITEIA
ncbi:MAG: 50S ribosomal protein L21 [Dehalococcoidia bacterium]|nr:50S ribosomal protein L21 [Dehalococcoidia bacterium]MQG16241.1 50S ribosomal protein L21 [SAR202 cluster bacterium]